MPSPTTSHLPVPRSWDEFEDICADLLKRMWRDRYVTRNGRSGQAQNGVDCSGRPEHLSGETAGAQCKRTETLSLNEISAEVEKASGFKPPLKEFLILTTSRRDAALQEEVRTTMWPFRVELLAWDDLSLELSGHPDLLKKHFPMWAKSTTSRDNILEILANAEPEDFVYDDGTGVHVYSPDVQLRLELDRTDQADHEFCEPWVEKFPDKRATVQVVYIVYGTTRIYEIYCAYVDGARHIIPYPKSRNELWIDDFKYRIGRILNHHIGGYGFDHALNRAGIVVRRDAEDGSTADDGTE